MTSQEIEPRQDVARVPVPRFLQEIGVQILEDKAIGARIVAIPREVRAKCNVIDPVTSLVQADPNWSPRISVCELDPAADGPHYYKQAGNKLAPTKQALETLAKAAGILYTRTERVPRSDLDAGEIGYRATVGIRRSDGTVEEILREKVWVEAAERAEIEEAVTRAEEWKDGKPVRGSYRFGELGSDTWKAEVEKRWLKELKDRYAKTESKAVLRAIRSALQIPHTFTPQDAAKPFLVVGFNFTPDYDDAEVKRMLVAAGLNAQAALYGRPSVAAVDLETGELTSAAEPTGTANEPTDVEEHPPAPDDQQAAEAAPVDAPQASASPPASAAPDEEPEPEPDLATEHEKKATAKEIAAAGKVVPPGKEQTVAEIVAKPENEDWCRWAQRTPTSESVGIECHAALVLYVKHKRAEWLEAV